MVWSFWAIWKKVVAPLPQAGESRPSVVKGAAAFGPQDGEVFSKLGQTGSQILTLRQFQYEEVGALVLGQVIDGGDARVVERGEDVGFALESGEALRVLGKRLGQHLDRHLAPELGVLGPVDHTHAALTELGGDLEVGKCLADHVAGILPLSHE